MAGQHYCLRWNNYQSNMTSVFHQLLRNEAFVDVTLACNDSSLKAHKVVLSACSSYFQKLLMENPCTHPTIIMPQDVCFSDLKFIIEFVYRGEIDVSQAELQSLLKTADQLKIKGLCEVPDGKDGGPGIGSAEVTPLPILSRRSFTKLRRLSGTKRQRPDAMVRRGIFKDGDHPPHPIHQLQQQQQQQQPQQHPQHMQQQQQQQQQQQMQQQQHQQMQQQALQQQQQQQQQHVQQVQQVQAVQVAQAQQQAAQQAAHQAAQQAAHQVAAQQAAQQQAQAAAQQQAQAQQQVAQAQQQQQMVAQQVPQGPNGQPMEMGAVSAAEMAQRSAVGLTERVPECVTVATSTEDDHDMPVVVLESKISPSHLMVPHSNAPTPVLTPHSMAPTPQMVMEGHPGSHSSGSGTDVDLPPEAQPAAPQATLVENMEMECSDRSRDMQDTSERNISLTAEPSGQVHREENVKVKFETLRAMEQADTIDIDSHMSERNVEDEHTMHTMMITPELLGLIPSSSGHSDLSGDAVKGSPKSWTQEHMEISGTYSLADVNNETTPKTGGGPKTWTQEDMEMALDALRNHNMSLTKASATYGIPSTTLWQRAHRLGIDTPKKEGPTKSWTEDNLNSALEALRTGTISANKASKAYGIPSSTLYKIARREGIRLAAPFNAAPTTWSPDDLERALESIRSGASSVQRASTEFGIPTGTLYGRCKREGIELSRSNPTPWSEDAMGEALEAVRVGQMSINQAAIHYNLPYSSLYGRFKRGKYEAEGHHPEEPPGPSPPPPQIMVVPYQQPPPPPPHAQHLPPQPPQHHSPQQHPMYQHSS